MNMKKIIVLALSAVVLFTLAACSGNTQNNAEVTQTAVSSSAAPTEAAQAQQSATSAPASSDGVTSTASVTSDGAIDASDLFTDRDLRQSADLTGAVEYTLSSGQTVTIDSAGVYILSGNAENAQVKIDAGDDDKVQLVLNGLNVTNSSTPVIYVVNTDKTFITTAEGTVNSLKVTGTFTADGDTKTDAVIFSRDDLTLNGLGALTIDSSDNGISCKDDLKLTGGTVSVTSAADAIEANDSIAVSGGVITINSQKDGLHSENDDDDSSGYIYICGGTFDITAASDGVQATTIVQIDGGAFSITAEEGIEATYVQINGGEISISASDDGINGSDKSSAYTVTVELNGGTVNIDMGQGDTDAVDSNGNLYINGGTVNINANSPFDYDGQGQLNGGTVTVNGQAVTQLTNQMMGGGPGGMGGMDGGFGGDMGGRGGNMNGGMGAPFG